MKNVILCVLLTLFVSCVNTTNENPSFGVREVVFFGGIINEPQIVKITAAGGWSIDETTIPKWLSVEPLLGFDSGEITIQTLSVNDSNSDRMFDLSLEVLGFESAVLNIIQKIGTVEELTDGIMNKTAEGYYKAGKEFFILDPKTMQVGGNIFSESYYLTSDDQTKILVLSFDSKPILYENSYISIQSKGIEDNISGAAECTLYKIQDGKLWFYDITKKIGFITREIKE